MNCCARFGGTWTRTSSREQSTSPSPDYAGKSKWTTTIQHSSAPCMVTDTVSAACPTKRDHVEDEESWQRRNFCNNFSLDFVPSWTSMSACFRVQSFYEFKNCNGSGRE